MWNAETNFKTVQEGLKLPGEYQPSPHLGVIKFHVIVYAKMQSELNVGISRFSSHLGQHCCKDNFWKLCSLTFCHCLLTKHLPVATT